MALNVVEILVRAKNETQGAFAEADATATGFSKALRTTMLVGAGAVALVGYESVKMATTFQAQMERLVTQAGVPQSALKTLQTGVLNLAGQVGFSPDSLAESLYHVASNMASLGASAPKMLSVVKIAAEGARIGGADLVDVTNALTAAVASGIPGVQNYSQAMGVLNATVGSGDMKMQDLAEALSTGVLAIAKQFGVTMRDAGAALATFGDNNIRGAKAGTELRMAIMDLAGQSKTGTAALAKLGIKSGELGADMRRGGLLSAISDLRSHLKAAGIPAKEWGSIMMEAFTKKSAAPLAVLLGQFDRLKSKYPDLEKGAAKFGDAWKKTNDTLAQKLADLRGKFDAVMTSIGEKLIPVLTRLAGFILSTVIPAIGQIVSWLAKHRDVVIAVAAGILTLLVPAFVAWAVAAGSAAVATIVAAAPLIAIAAGVALLVYAILQLAHHWKQVWHDIKAWVSDAVNFIKAHWQLILAILTGPVGLAVLFIKDHWAEVTRIVGDVIDWIKGHWPLLLAILTGPIGLAVLFIVDHWHQIVTGAQRMFDDVIGFFKRLPGDILSALGNLGSLLWNAGVNVMKGLIGGITSMIGSVGSTMSGIAHKVAGFFGLSPAKEGPLAGGGAPEIRGRHFVQAFARGMTDGLPDLGSAVSRAAGRAGGFGPGLAGGGGYGGGQLQLEVTGGSGVFEQFMAKFIRDYVRVKGGGGPFSVQRAFGLTWPQGA